MHMDKKPIKVGGQAVIEGVMMRSPEYVAVAVRKPDDRIVVRRDRFVSWAKKRRILGWPLIRGGVVLIESLVLGIKALNFSSEVAMAEAEDVKQKGKPPTGQQNKWLLAGTLILSLGMGFALFFYLPLLLTEWSGVKDGVVFNLVDGGIRLAVFLLYLGLISLWKEIRRIFAYHGAEHKSIFAFEAGRPLTVGNVREFTTHHPRCGTSFLLVVMLVSILVFILLGRPERIADRLVRFLFIPVIGGISYEIIQLSAKKWGRWIASTLTAPGLWLQRITTQEPDDKQIEVALAALKASLGMKQDASVEPWTRPAGAETP